MKETREETFQRVLKYLKKKNKTFHIALDMGPRRKARLGGSTVNCLVYYGAKRLGSFGGYAEHKFLVDPEAVWDISSIDL